MNSVMGNPTAQIEGANQTQSGRTIIGLMKGWFKKLEHLQLKVQHQWLTTR
jgi:hypothetical protein